jgi:4-amino-4-deoxy-L-arabinose transferase-like glycosyltransferase
VPETKPAGSRLTVAAWVLLLAFAALVLARIATHDFRDQPLAGDASAHLLQALSIAYDSHTLNFDQQDMVRWRSLEWTAEPVGLFFQRYDGDLYGFAKPYGYSLYLAPFVAVFGAPTGVGLANALLLTLLIGISIALLRTRYDGPAVPLLVGAFFLAAYPYMYGYPIHTELFLALLVLIAFASAVRFAQTAKPVWALLSFATMAFGLSEKAAFVALFAPLAAFMLWRASGMRLRAGMVGVGVVVFAIAVIPYLHYSDGQSFTPYGGKDRLYVSSSAPFGGGQGFSGTSFAPSEQVSSTIFADPMDKLRAGAYYLVGRHTGMLVYLPVALLLLIAAIAYVRRTDGWAQAALLGVLAYIAFYVMLFPLNYFGGGQSLGNRYFLQAAPALLAVAVLSGFARRMLTGIAVAGIALGVVFLLPHHAHPDSAFVHIERTSWPQRLLPFESNQDTADYFRCEKRNVTNITVCE